MRDRIMDELGGRSDLASQIDACIGDAIAAYQNDRFTFSESRTTCTFNTVIGQEFYTSSDNSAIATLFFFDYVIITIGGVTPFELKRREPKDLELASNSATIRGQPTDFAYYDSQIRLYPVPSAVYPVRVAAQMNIAPPASDTEVGNKWMTDAERLIRSRAKYELSLNYGVDFPDLAAKMHPDTGASADAFSELKGATNKLTGTGRMTPTQF